AAKTISDAEKVTITAEGYPSLLEENEAVIDRIQSHHAAGVPYEDMAVLYRINRNPAQLLRLLETRGIPVQVKGTTGGPFHHWICQDFCSYLAAANGSTRRADWLRVISHPERYFSRSALGQEPVTLDRLFDYYSDDRRRIDTLDHLSYDMTLLRKSPPYAGLSHLRRYMGYDDYLEENDKSGEGRLQEIAEQLQETADGCRTGLEWLAYVEKMQQGGGHSATRTDGKSQAAAEGMLKDAEANMPTGVHFMTMHGAKGLEFPIVFIVDANEGMTPYKRADSPEGIEEERRLFYVAMTRAKEHLHISWTKERFHRPQSVSRFVSEAGLWQVEPKKTSWRERLGR
ncbi:MAG: ATP-dependent helicase, partial [Lachnospiraceae bacterium]|nr:ATP-dependent helicase [Lachnospiraceae bacterium]